MITQQIKLNLIPGQVLPRFNVSQYDKGSRTLRFLLYNGEQVFTIPSGMTAQINGTKPDNKGFAYTVVSAASGGNLIVADLEQQMTAIAGEVMCELVLIQGDQRLGTCNFIIHVKKAALNDESDISTSDLPAIIAEATAQMEAAAQSASEAASSAQAAEESADKAETYGTHLPYIGANGNWFVYNVTTQQYEDSGVKAQGPLSGLTDVEIKNAQDGQEITYDGTTQKWKNTSKIQTLTNQVKDMNNVLGAKNLLPFSLELIKAINEHHSWNGNVCTTNTGLTFTVETDKNGNLLYIDVNGTASESTSFFLAFQSVREIEVGDYLLSGCTGGSKNGYRLYANDKSYIVNHHNFDGDTAFTVTPAVDNFILRIFVDTSTVMNHVKFYPMIRLASITDDTYAPYAKTNRELTEKTASIESNILAINTHLSQLDFDGAGAHNSIYRGKYLGAEVTAEQYAHIADGTFKDMYIGDYWAINGVNYRIGHFDYWYNTGDTNCKTHHVVIVPDTNLYSAQMNTENVTTGGYYNSKMRGGSNYLVSGSSNLYNAKVAIDNAFGSAHILSHREMLTNGVSNGNASGWAWYDSTVDLMSEVMVYGTLVWSVGGEGYEVGIDKEQLALFRLNHSRICNRVHWWLRSVHSASYFAYVTDSGYANYGNASSSLGVRPTFGLRA